MQAQHLLHLAGNYAAHTGKKPSTLGVYAVNDGKFFGRLQAGSSCSLRTADRVLNWFHENWPDDLAWPSDIPRPVTDAKKRRVA